MKREDDGMGPVLALVIVLLVTFTLMVLASCSALEIDGGCHYQRTVTTSYTCEPGGTLEHKRLAPGGTPEP